MSVRRAAARCYPAARRNPARGRVPPCGVRQLMNHRLPNASRATVAVNTEYGAGQFTSHAAMTDADDVATPIIDIASAVQPPSVHLIAQPSSGHCSHVNARTSQHSRSAIGRPL